MACSGKLPQVKLQQGIICCYNSNSLSSSQNLPKISLGPKDISLLKDWSIHCLLLCNKKYWNVAAYNLIMSMHWESGHGLPRCLWFRALHKIEIKLLAQIIPSQGSTGDNQLPSSFKSLSNPHIFTDSWWYQLLAIWASSGSYIQHGPWILLEQSFERES